MHSMTARTFDLGGSVDTPSRLENGAVNYHQRNYAQYSTNDQQLCHASALSAFRRS
jgi:hypothetical protein